MLNPAPGQETGGGPRWIGHQHDAITGDPPPDAGFEITNPHQVDRLRDCPFKKADQFHLLIEAEATISRLYRHIDIAIGPLGTAGV